MLQHRSSTASKMSPSGNSTHGVRNSAPVGHHRAMHEHEPISRCIEHGPAAELVTATIAAVVMGVWRHQADIQLP
jgi:hypothetical protein